jgi:hypothetical protein
MGFPRARTEGLFGGEPWLSGPVDIAADLRRLRDAGAFELRDPAAIILTAEEARLAQARDDAVVLTDALADIAEAAQALLHRDVAGLGSLSATRRAGRYFQRAFAVRYCLLLRDLVPSERIDAIAAVAPHAAVLARGITGMRKAMPGYRKYIKADMPEQLADMPLEARELLHRQVNKYVDRTPGLAALIDSEDTSKQ